MWDRFRIRPVLEYVSDPSKTFKRHFNFWNIFLSLTGSPHSYKESQWYLEKMDCKIFSSASKVVLSFHLIFLLNHQLQNFWSTYSGRFHAFCTVWELENPAFCEMNSRLVRWLVETGWDILSKNVNSAPTRAILFLLGVVHKLRWLVLGFFLTTYPPLLTVSTYLIKVSLVKF